MQLLSRTTLRTGTGQSSAELIRTAFNENQEELTWLAEYLTGDNEMAVACVIDAEKRTELDCQLGHEWLWSWPRDATILSAMELEHTRIGDLACVYERRGCAHGQSGHLSPETIDLLAGATRPIQFQFDALCRFVFVLCCLENRPLDEAALFLGLGTVAVEGAYCAVLEALELTCCEVIGSSCGSESWN